MKMRTKSVRWPMSRALKPLFATLVLLLLLGAAYHRSSYVEYRPTSTNSSPSSARRLWSAKEMLQLEYGDNGTADRVDVEQYDERLLEYIRSRVSAPARRDHHHQSNNASSTLEQDHSQIGQSKLVDELLSRRTNGFFVEAGTGDGELFSNSLFFERARNWTGLLVEPNPEFHRSILGKNRHSYVIKACLGTDGHPRMLKMKMAGLVGGIVTENVTQDKAALGSWYNRVVAYPTVSVLCFPFNSILEALDVHHVDYFSLDIEGAELSILQTIDLKRFTVDVFSIEYNTDAGKLDKIRAFFNVTGNYKEVALITSQDVIFMRTREP